MTNFRNFLLLTILCHCGHAKKNQLVEIGEDMRDFLDVNREIGDDKEMADADGWWSPWSPWTTCSRLCDGGITRSLRTCIRKKKKGKGGKSFSPPRCPGEFIRRRICNMHPCAEPRDFRAAQCSTHNSRPYRGKMYVWLPFYDPEDPCTLTCQAEGYNFVVKLSTNVLDGTRCREGALDMCVQGQCKPVGCDLEVGSTLKVDECGVCGGDGSACASAPVFVWSPKPFGPCPVTCGGGVQVSEPACLQKDTKQEVDPRLCDISLRPRTQTRPCNQFQCPIVWQPAEWGPCSSTCGPGVQTRTFKCVQGGVNGTQMEVKGGFCPRHKPPSERSCFTQECPRWFQGIWSECSVTCGMGIQRRAVVCRNDKGQYSEDCDHRTKPEVQQECHTGMPCPKSPTTTEPPPCIPETTPEISVPSRPPKKVLATTTATTKTMATTATATTVPKITDKGIEVTKPRATLRPEGKAPTTALPPISSTLRSSTTTSTTAARTDREGLKTTPFPTESGKDLATESKIYRGTFFLGEWNLCSATCGPGHRRRLVQCRLKLDLPADTIAILPDSECPGQRPIDVERCSVWCLPPETTLAPSLPSAAHQISTASAEDASTTATAITTALAPAPTTTPRTVVWKVVGEILSPCTVICPPDITLHRVMCIQQADGRETPVGGKCDKASITEGSCKNGSCVPPPRWQVEEYSPCSVSCGGGWRMRQVRCVQQSSFYESKEVEVDSNLCPQPPPKQQDLCNVVDCPPRWKAEQWSKCSRSCGGGFQTRKLRCEMRMAHPTERIVQLPPSKCMKARPKASQPCNRQPCPYSLHLPKFVALTKAETVTTPAIEVAFTSSSSTTTTAHEFSSSDANDGSAEIAQYLTSRRVTTKASGTVSVYKGSMIKVHCPEHWSAGSNHSAGVLWFKGRRRIGMERRVKSSRVSVSAKGALRIRKVNFGDAATYTCLAGPFRSDLRLLVRPLPPSGFSDEEGMAAHQLTSSTPVTTPGTGSSENVDEEEKKSDPHLRMRHYHVNPNHFERTSATSPIESDDGDDEVNETNISRSHLKWRVGPWSPCTHTCGKDALQIRDLQCIVDLTSRTDGLHREVKAVSDSLCVNNALPRPPTTRICVNNPLCPKWVTGKWSECSENNCVALDTAYQKRDVYCESDYIRCDEVSRPRRKRECFQPKCKSLWRTGPWSECTATCGDKGFRTRKVECVWNGSGLSAGVGTCRDKKPPDTTSPCQGPPCGDGMDCVNHSSYCEVVRKAKLCRMSHFRLQCCASCSVEESTKY